MFYQIDTLFVQNRTTVVRRRVARNSQLGAVLGGGGTSRPPEARGSKNFAFF